MGTLWSCGRYSTAHSSAASATHLAGISEKEVLTLCDDGDLLLMREPVVHAKLGVAIDKQVAQDITRFQHGEFPSARVTQLAAWTSCALLLRLNGELHILEVTPNNLQLVPFQDRVAGRVSRRDMYAIRRLQQGRTEQTSTFLRKLAFEISQALPLCWTLPSPHDHLSPDSVPPSHASESGSHIHDSPLALPSSESLPSIRDAISKHATLHAVLQRALQLFHHSNQPLSARTQLDDASAQLATAVAISIYEHLTIVPPSSSQSPQFLLSPSCLTSRAQAVSSQVAFVPCDALGIELRLT